MAAAGVSTERVEAATGRYLEAVGRLRWYLATTRKSLCDMVLPSGRRLARVPLLQRLYGLARRYQGERLLRELAPAVPERLIRGASWTEVLAVVDAGTRALDLPFNLAEAARLREFVGCGVSIYDFGLRI